MGKKTINYEGYVKSKNGALLWCVAEATYSTNTDNPYTLSLEVDVTDLKLYNNDGSEHFDVDMETTENVREAMIDGLLCRF